MPEETPRIIYLSLIGFAALSYVLYEYRGRMGTALQSMVVWALIFVAAITLYGFKDVFTQQVFSGGTAQISPDTIRLPLARDGHYYAVLEVNGARVEFLVDTGASDIVLSINDAERAGINLDNLRYFGEAETANGTVRTAGITLNTVKLEDRVDYDLRASVTDGEMDGSLLGMAYLSRFSRIEIVKNSLYLHR